MEFLTEERHFPLTGASLLTHVLHQSASVAILVNIVAATVVKLPCSAFVSLNCIILMKIFPVEARCKQALNISKRRWVGAGVRIAFVRVALKSRPPSKAKNIVAFSKTDRQSWGASNEPFRLNNHPVICLHLVKKISLPCVCDIDNLVLWDEDKDIL